MLRKLYDWALDHARRPHAERWLVAVTFVDGGIFPVPPEIMQIPMSIARPERALRYAAVGSLTSLAAAFVGYGIGAFLFQKLGLPLLQLAGREAEFNSFAAYVSATPLLWGLGFLIAPMPAALAAGSVELALPMVIVASLIGRGSRFFAIALLLKRYGAAAERLIDRYLHHVMGAVALLVAGLVVIRYAL